MVEGAPERSTDAFREYVGALDSEEEAAKNYAELIRRLTVATSNEGVTNGVPGRV
jgi:hypothetical protein